MPAVRILRQTVAARANVRPGDVLQLSNSEANLLIGSGKAELVREEAPASPAPTPAADPPAAAPAPASRRKRGQA